MKGRKGRKEIMGPQRTETRGLNFACLPCRGNGVGCKHSSGECWSMIAGWLGREEVFANHREECRL